MPEPEKNTKKKYTQDTLDADLFDCVYSFEGLSNRREALEQLLANGANINAIRNDKTALMHAITGHSPIATVKKILEHGCEINKMNNNEETALMIAVKENNAEIIKILVDSGANINLCGRYGYTPLILSASMGKYRAMSALIDAGADVNVFSRFEKSALSYLSELDGNDCFELLLKSGADPNKRTPGFNVTPLMQAVERNDSYKIKTLVKYGADISAVSAKDNNGEPVLFKTLKKVDLNCLKLLTKLGFNINDKDNDGNTLLMKSLIKNADSGKILKFFKANNGNLTVTNRYGETALFLAVEHGHFDLVDELINSGVDLNVKNKKGDTVLMCCIKKDMCIPLKKLLKAGVDVHVKNNQGEDALSQAKMKGRLDMIPLIEECIAEKEFSLLNESIGEDSVDCPQIMF